MRKIESRTHTSGLFGAAEWLLQIPAHIAAEGINPLVQKVAYSYGHASTLGHLDAREQHAREVMLDRAMYYVLKSGPSGSFYEQRGFHSLEEDVRKGVIHPDTLVALPGDLHPSRAENRLAAVWPKVSRIEEVKEIAPTPSPAEPTPSPSREDKAVYKLLEDSRKIIESLEEEKRRNKKAIEDLESLMASLLKEQMKPL